MPPPGSLATSYALAYIAKRLSWFEEEAWWHLRELDDRKACSSAALIVLLAIDSRRPSTALRRETFRRGLTVALLRRKINHSSLGMRSLVGYGFKVNSWVDAASLSIGDVRCVA